MFHKHEWKILTEKITESPMEQFQRLGGTSLKTGTGIYTDPIIMFKRKHIVIFSCKHCLKTKKIVTDI